MNSNQGSLKIDTSSHIWDDVNELTDGIFVFGNLIFGRSTDEARIKNVFSQWFQRYKKNSPNHVVINLNEYPTNNFENLEGMPRYLPNLSNLRIISSNFKSFKGLPEKLPKLKEIEIGFRNRELFKIPLKNLNHLPSSLPSIESIRIFNSQLETLEGLPSQLDSLIGFSVYKSNLQSLRHLPHNLPNLKSIRISYSHLNSLKYFPTPTPNLNCCDFSNNKIESLKYLPSELPKVDRFDIMGNPLKSFEKLPVIKNPHRFILNTSVRTLYDLTNRFLNDGERRNISNTRFIDIYWLFNYTNYLFGQSENEINNSLCPYVLNLLRKFKIKIIRYTDSAYEEIHEIPYSDEAYNDLEYEFSMNNDYDGLKRLHTDYAPNPEIFKEIVEIYRKSPMELAIQYSQNQKSLTEGELDRLCWEAETDERKILENSISSNDPIFQKINRRLSTEIKNGLNIYL